MNDPVLAFTVILINLLGITSVIIFSELSRRSDKLHLEKLKSIEDMHSDSKHAAMIVAITKSVAGITLIETAKWLAPKGHNINEAEILLSFNNKFNNAIIEYVKEATTQDQQDQQQEKDQ